jgi:hypothetical protein
MTPPVELPAVTNAKALTDAYWFDKHPNRGFRAKA